MIGRRSLFALALASAAAAVAPAGPARRSGTHFVAGLQDLEGRPIVALMRNGPGSYLPGGITYVNYMPGGDFRPLYDRSLPVPP